MTADELVIIARVASHYDRAGLDREWDTLDLATRDVVKFKRDAHQLWVALWNNSKLTSREVGDQVWILIQEWRASGMSLKNFSHAVMERA